MHIGLTMILSSTKTNVFLSIGFNIHICWICCLQTPHGIQSVAMWITKLDVMKFVCLQVLGSGDVSQDSTHKSAKHVSGRPIDVVFSLLECFCNINHCNDSAPCWDLDWTIKSYLILSYLTWKSWSCTIMILVFVECSAPCTLKNSFVNFEK